MLKLYLFVGRVANFVTVLQIIRDKYYTENVWEDFIEWNCNFIGFYCSLAAINITCCEGFKVGVDVAWKAPNACIS